MSEANSTVGSRELKPDLTGKAEVTAESAPSGPEQPVVGVASSEAASTAAEHVQPGSTEAGAGLTTSGPAPASESLPVSVAEDSGTEEGIPAGVTSETEAAMAGGTQQAAATSAAAAVPALEAPAPASHIADGADVIEWQRKLLPVMTYMILGLTVFFFAATLLQLLYLHFAIANRPKFDESNFTKLAGVTFADPEDALEAGRFDALAQLELHTIQRRYHQANVFLMSRVWVRYLGFVTGMILALVGATFILGKMREPESKIKTEVSGLKLSFVGASPGIFLVLAGLVLMLITIAVHRDIGVTDGALYVGEGASYLTNLLAVASEQSAGGLDITLPPLPTLEPSGTPGSP